MLRNILLALALLLAPLAQAGQPPTPYLIKPLGQSHIPFILPSSGTVATNGTVTLTTALPTTYSGGAYVYFPTGAVTTPVSPGWYWTVFSSTTVGQVYQSQYSSGTPVVPSGPVAAVGSNSAYTQTPSAVTAYQLNIPVNTLGANDSLRLLTLMGFSSSTNNKSVSLTIGAIGFFQITEATSGIVSYIDSRLVSNRGSQSYQVTQSNFYAFTGASGNANNYTTVNFAAAQTLAYQLQLAVPTDFIVLETSQVEQIKGVP